MPNPEGTNPFQQAGNPGPQLPAPLKGPGNPAAMNPANYEGSSWDPFLFDANRGEILTFCTKGTDESWSIAQGPWKMFYQADPVGALLMMRSRLGERLHLENATQKQLASIGMA